MKLHKTECETADTIIRLVVKGEPLAPEMSRHVDDCQTCREFLLKVQSVVRTAAEHDEFCLGTKEIVPQDRVERIAHYAEMAYAKWSQEDVGSVGKETVDAIQTDQTEIEDGRADEALLETEGQARKSPRRLGDYELLDVCGKGGMGVVYRARQRSADRIVALKVIRRDKLNVLDVEKRKELVERFRNEAIAAGRLEHDNIITIFEVGQIQGQPYYSMRHVEGTTLAEILEKGPLDQKRAAAYLEQVARAIHVAHAAGILHRDLRPSNILIDSKVDRPLVIDFGLAKLREGGNDLTVIGDVFGCPPYMSPEQTQNSASVTAAADIYSVGASLYHVLCGRAPFTGNTSVEIIRQINSEEPAAPRQINASIDPALEAICLKCLEKESAQRYPSALELAEDLSRYLSGEPVRALMANDASLSVADVSLWQYGKGHPLLATVAACAMIVLAMVAASVSVAYVREARLNAEAQHSLSVANGHLTASQTELSDAREALEKVTRELRVNRTELAAARDSLDRETALAEAQREEQRQREDGDLSANGDDVQAKLASAERSLGSFTKLLARLGTSRFDLGLAHHRAKRSNEAHRDLLVSVEIRRRLVDEDLADAKYRFELVQSQKSLGDVLFQANRFDEAETQLLEAIDHGEKLVAMRSGVQEYDQLLGNCYGLLDNLYYKARQFAKCEPLLRRAIEIREQLVQQYPHSGGLAIELGGSYCNLGNAILALGSPENALEWYHRSIETLQKGSQLEPANRFGHEFLRNANSGLATSLGKIGRTDEAVAAHERAVQILENLRVKRPDEVSYTNMIAYHYMQLGDLALDQGSLDSSLHSYSDAVAAAQENVSRHPEDQRHKNALKACYEKRARVLAELGRHDEAQEDRSRADQLTPAAANEPRDDSRAASAENSKD